MNDSYKRFFGKKYSLSEAQKVQDSLQEEVPTGESWYWKNEEGDYVQLSGTSKKVKGPINHPRGYWRTL
jgi:hypothetical protein